MFRKTNVPAGIVIFIAIVVVISLGNTQVARADTFGWLGHSTTTGAAASYCIDDPDYGGSGTYQQIWTCHDVPQEQFAFESSTFSGGYTGKEDYDEIKLANGLCLDDTNGSTTNGISLQVWTCNDDEDQAFYVAENSYGVYSFWTAHYNSSGDPMCIDDTGDVNANGNELQLWQCLGDNSQAWVYYSSP